MRPIKFTIFVAFSLIGAIFSTMAGAADEPGMDEKPSFFASQSVKVTAVVEAIDLETRVVTLRRQQGDTVTFTVGDEARNLDQVFAVMKPATWIRFLSAILLTPNMRKSSPSKSWRTTARNQRNSSLPAWNGPPRARCPDSRHSMHSP